MLVFSAAFAENEEVLKCGEPILLKGNVQEEGDAESKSYKIRCDETIQLSVARREKVSRVRVDLDVTDISNGELGRLKHLFSSHRGTCRTAIVVSLSNTHGEGKAVLPLPESYWVEPNDELMMQVERLFRRRVMRLS